MPTRLDTFIDTYSNCLTYAVENYPYEYMYTVDTVPNVIARMIPAIERGSFNKDTRAFKDTCKKLGIKHTYKAIKEYINS